MRTKLVPIGNSKGVRLPKAVLEQAGLEGEIELEVRPGAVVVRPVSGARQGWDAAFSRMARRGDDALLDEPQAHAETEWDREGWTW